MKTRNLLSTGLLALGISFLAPAAFGEDEHHERKHHEPQHNERGHDDHARNNHNRGHSDYYSRDTHGAYGHRSRATATPVIAVAPITTADTTVDTTVATGHVAATATATTPLPCGVSGTCSAADHRFHLKPQPINSIMKYQNHRITSLAAALCLPAIALTSAIATAEDKAN